MRVRFVSVTHTCMYNAVRYSVLLSIVKRWQCCSWQDRQGAQNKRKVEKEEKSEEEEKDDGDSNGIEWKEEGRLISELK